jgi:hypothetical protein
MTMDVPFTKDDVLKKLETIYWRALQGGSWGIALRAAELQGKAIGLFEKQPLPKVASIAEMTEEQLTEFIDRLEKRDPCLKDRAGEPTGEGHFPEKEPGKVAAPESPQVQGDAMPEGEYGHPSVTLMSPPHYRQPGREELANNLYFQGNAEAPVPSHPPPEWERPPPIVWSAF